MCHEKTFQKHIDLIIKCPNSLNSVINIVTLKGWKICAKLCSEILSGNIQNYLTPSPPTYTEPLCPFLVKTKVKSNKNKEISLGRNDQQTVEHCKLVAKGLKDLQRPYEKIRFKFSFLLTPSLPI